MDNAKVKMNKGSWWEVGENLLWAQKDCRLDIVNLDSWSYDLNAWCERKGENTPLLIYCRWYKSIEGRVGNNDPC